MKKRSYGFVKKLAGQCDCTPEHMSYILNGHRTPSRKLALRIETSTNGSIKAVKLLFPDQRE
jgi:hypothetical protein